MARGRRPNVSIALKDGYQECEVARIVNRRVYARNGSIEYLLKWRGGGASWVPEEDCRRCKPLIRKFLKGLAASRRLRRRLRNGAARAPEQPPDHLPPQPNGEIVPADGTLRQIPDINMEEQRRVEPVDRPVDVYQMQRHMEPARQGLFHRLRGWLNGLTRRLY